MNVFTKLWVTWAVIGLIIEMAALLRGQSGDTLSEHIWSLKGSGFYSLIIFFLLWMIYHFIFDNKG